MSARILIVAEDLAMRESLDLFLTFEGYETFTCTRYSDIHNFIHNFTPNLILLHISNWRLRNRETLEHLKLSTYQKSVPIILVSDMDSNKERVLNHLIVTPFDEKKILDKIHVQLAKQGFVEG
ncbi:hypothetical protein [Desertivirga brevis]|uniref:hypothetical protein n=1 Tax=Desertivirga brevis TaxID=2810310 RepID=UPI001A97200E|nr:hypothetical protein [Pedobacter sp. SYSU D00873]